MDSEWIIYIITDHNDSPFFVNYIQKKDFKNFQKWVYETAKISWGNYAQKRKDRKENPYIYYIRYLYLAFKINVKFYVIEQGIENELFASKQTFSIINKLILEGYNLTNVFYGPNNKILKNSPHIDFMSKFKEYITNKRLKILNNAKAMVFTDPNGIEYYVEGSFNKFCRKNKLRKASMWDILWGNRKSLYKGWTVRYFMGHKLKKMKYYHGQITEYGKQLLESENKNLTND